MSEWIAKWSGEYPNLCCGEWTLYKDGEPIKDIPFKEASAYTYGMYRGWSFDEDMNEYFYAYVDGMGADDWIENYREWLEAIADESEFNAIYDAFAEEDWRSGSCGGCI